MDSTWVWSCVARQSARCDSEDDGGGGAKVSKELDSLEQTLSLNIF